MQFITKKGKIINKKAKEVLKEYEKAHLDKKETKPKEVFENK